MNNLSGLNENAENKAFYCLQTFSYRLIKRTWIDTNFIDAIFYIGLHLTLTRPNRIGKDTAALMIKYSQM